MRRTHTHSSARNLRHWGRYELSLPLPDVVPMQTRQPSLEGTGEVRLRRLVKEALRMRPDRIIVGEVRQEECLDLLLALNSGVPGLATVHANSARDAVGKLCMLPLLAAENVTSAFIVPTVAATLDLVVFITRDASGRRRVAEVCAVPGRCEDGVIEVETIFRTEGGALARADGYPPHLDRFERAGYDLVTLLAPDWAPPLRAGQHVDRRVHGTVA
jgi:pilus assembly protein CpaF